MLFVARHLLSESPYVQKELQIDFGFKSPNTAATHWRCVLAKFKVASVFELRTKFRQKKHGFV